MTLNHRVITATLLIMAAGAYNVLLVKRSAGGKNARSSVTRVIVGAYILAIVVSIIDLISPQTTAVTGGLLMVAVVTAIYTVLPDLFQRLGTRPASK